MLHNFLLWCQWPGAVLGIVGAVWATGTTNKARFWGFFLWVLSDVFWLAYGYEVMAIGLLVSFAYFTCTSLRGMWSNRAKPSKGWHSRGWCDGAAYSVVSKLVEAEGMRFPDHMHEYDGPNRVWLIDRFIHLYDDLPTDTTSMTTWLESQRYLWAMLNDAERVCTLNRLRTQGPACE